MSILSDNLITLANGSKIRAQDLSIGDVVADGYGNNVLIRGVRNFYDVHPWNSGLNPRKINNEIVVLKDQIFMGADGYFYIIDGVDNDLFYFHLSTNFFTENVTLSSLHNYNIKDRTKKLEIGSIIMKDTGPVEVNSIEILDPIFPTPCTWENYQYKSDLVDPSTVFKIHPLGTGVYKHKVDVRGTYIVDDYICLAAQNEFWDYDNNVPVPPNKVYFMQDPVTRIFERTIVRD